MCVCVYVYVFFEFIYLFIYLFILGILFIYISTVFPFLGLPFRNPLSHLPSPCLYDSAHPPTYPLPSSHPGIPLLWDIKNPQIQRPLLPLMSNKVIVCHKCGRIQGSLHVYSLVGGTVPENFRGSGLLTLLLPTSSLRPSSITE